MTSSAGPQAARARGVVERLLAGVPARLAHSRVVAERAAVLPLPRPELETLVTAAWLHDVGYSEGVAETGFHPLDGARWLQRHDWDDDVVALVAHHSGAPEEAAVRGLSAELAGLPRPDSRLLDLLTWADMTTGPTGDVVSVHDRLHEILERYDEDDPVSMAVRRSAPSLTRAVETVEMSCLRTPGLGPDPVRGQPPVTRE